MLIPFTQYLRPHGQQVDNAIDVDEATGNMARELIDAGARFEAEVPSAGLVFFECINTNVDEDDPMFSLSNQLVKNGIKVKDAMVELVQCAYERMFGERQKKLS